ncbi:hypothetical protein H4R33_006717 [Dimargaris cristalligena]|uniref:Uncharacterized protein n=1 Tax=Dimargaris cristalligena TaxID=215637 RepID=A0A4P9ZM63_9FUNG|nr:hypothetical protein H4R33_006717 [Dimargaris cristalligena]RKP34387.1 hypothetical protein BJ085DRAFT_38721 [Dimargaris cristalligena]|eukprot:RKP34387.1 hypothetical protein BJ085DRAFT_38721 [Dimargaris cristalligena]
MIHPLALLGFQAYPTVILLVSAVLSIAYTCGVSANDNFTLVVPPSRGHGNLFIQSTKAPCGGYASPGQAYHDVQLKDKILVRVNEGQSGSVVLNFRPDEANECVDPNGESSQEWWPLAEKMVTSRMDHALINVDFTRMNCLDKRGTMQAVFYPTAGDPQYWSKYVERLEDPKVSSTDDDPHADTTIDIALAGTLHARPGFKGLDGYTVAPLYQCADVIIREITSHGDDEGNGTEPQYRHSTAGTVALGVAAVFTAALLLSD